jgi:hypothetical protein
MARKISGGAVGEPSVGAIQVAPTAVITAATDQNITLSPTGTASVVVTNNMLLNAQNDLRWGDSDSSNWVAFQGPATVASNITWTLPATDGSSNQVLTTNGSGTLSWSTAAVTISDNTSDSGTNYVAFTTATSGSITTARVSTTGLTFQPSTGTLSAGPAIFNGTVNSLRLENIKTASYTLALVDRDKVVAFNGTGDQTVTIPLNSEVAFPIGSVVYICRLNTGTLTLAVSAGVTVNKTGSFGGGEEIYCRKRAENTWVVVDAPKTLTATGGTLLASGGFNNHTYTSGTSTFVVA